MEKLKSLPICHILKNIYPDLYPVHIEFNFEAGEWPKTLQLSFSNVDRNGVYLLDAYDCLYLYICKSVSHLWLNDVFGVTQWAKIPDDGENFNESGDPKIYKAFNYNQVAGLRSGDSKKLLEMSPIPRFDNPTSKKLNAFVDYLISNRPSTPHFFLLK